MSREQDPNVGDIGNIEVEDPRAGKGRKKAPAGGGDRGRGGRGPAGGGAGGGSGGQGPWIMVSLGLLALMLVMGAWTYGEISSLRQRLDQAVDRSGQRLDNLESLLSATDETLSQSANSIQGRLKTHMSEIRKLWDVSNKRNRGWIKDNEQQLKSLEATTGKLESRIQSLSSAIEKLRGEVKTATREQGKTRTQVDLLAETVQQLEEADARFEKRLTELQDLRKEWDSLEQRLKRMEEAIDAFDAYRRQVNQRLQALEEQGTGP